MSNQMNTEELKTIIVNKIKEIGLNDVLDNTIVDKIKNKVMNIYNHEQAQNSIPEVIPEAVSPANMGTTEIGMMPNPTGETPSTTETMGTEPEMGVIQHLEIGTTGNIPAYTPELPSFMDKIEPAKVIIFSQNELSEGGENLSNKPLRTFSDPDVKKSMNDFWLDKGQKKADVYMAKLEKIGELEFNYANGTTVFTEKRFEPDFEAQAKYKENPYAGSSSVVMPSDHINVSGQPNIMNQIASSVDINQVVTDIVMNILKNQLLTNTEKAVSAGEFNSDTMLPKTSTGVPMYPLGAVKPEGIAESFSIKMIDLVNEYEKIDAPANLKEAIEKNNKKFLVKENEEVQEWLVEGKTYYTPVVKMSTRKCYIKS